MTRNHDRSPDRPVRSPTDQPTPNITSPTPHRITRRRALQAGFLGGATGLSGCLGFFETESVDQQQLVQDRPDAVYVPTHIDGMEMVGMASPDDYQIAVSVSTPHQFWLVTGTDRSRVTVTDDVDVHLMVTLVEPETGIALPNGNVEVTVKQDGEEVDRRSMWPMLSQRMGFHFGDNVPLGGEGTYEVTTSLSPMNVRRTGGFRGRFSQSVETSFTYEFSPEAVQDIMYQPLPDEQGNRGAVQPMQMEMLPVHQLPSTEDVPGELVGETTSADARFVVVRHSDPPTGVEGSKDYLAVSARTPYNRYPIPFMSLSATVTGGGETLFDGPLQATIDPDLDYHYGATVDDLSGADTITLSVGAPPQVARHEGYETAFFTFEDQQIQIG